jgi:c-di-GMP-binding flagellar brake protein YcgR
MFLLAPPTAPARRAELAPFRVTDRVHIHGMVSALAKTRAVVALFPDGEGDAVLSAVLHVEPGRLVLDLPADAGACRNLLAASGTTLVSAAQGVRVEAELGRLDLQGDGLHARIPDELLRVQRRAAFRVPMGAGTTLQCWLPGALATEVRVLDLSAGGVGLLMAPRVAEGAAVGTLLRGCLLTLPAAEERWLSVSLQARRLQATRGGAWRGGFAFIGLPAGKEQLIRSYVLLREREARPPR